MRVHWVWEGAIQTLIDPSDDIWCYHSLTSDGWQPILVSVLVAFPQSLRKYVEVTSLSPKPRVNCSRLSCNRGNANLASDTPSSGRPPAWLVVRPWQRSVTSEARTPAQGFFSSIIGPYFLRRILHRNAWIIVLMSESSQLVRSKLMMNLVTLLLLLL